MDQFHILFPSTKSISSHIVCFQDYCLEIEIASLQINEGLFVCLVEETKHSVTTKTSDEQYKASYTPVLVLVDRIMFG